MTSDIKTGLIKPLNITNTENQSSPEFENEKRNSSDRQQDKQGNFRIRTSRSPSPKREDQVSKEDKQKKINTINQPKTILRSKSPTIKNKEANNGNNQPENEEKQNNPDKIMVPLNLVKTIRNANRTSRIAEKMSVGQAGELKALPTTTEALVKIVQIDKSDQNVQLKKQSHEIKLAPLKQNKLENGISPRRIETQISPRTISPKKMIQAKEIAELNLQKNKIEGSGSLDQNKIGSDEYLTSANRGKLKKNEKNLKKKELEKTLMLQKKKKEIQQAQRIKEEERLRLEKIRRQEEEMYLRREKDRLKQEENQVQKMNEFYHERQKSLFKKVRQKESWDITTHCNEGRLKLYDKLEMDSYRFEIENNLSFEKLQSFEEYLTKMEAGLQNLNHIENYLYRLQEEENPQDEVDWHAKYYSNLKELLIQKLSDVLQQEKWKELVSIGHDINSLMRSNAFEERQKVEILKEYTEFDRIKFVYWINPNGKGGRRLKPVDFTLLHVSVEVPRPFIQSKIIMTGFWMEMDYNQFHLQYTHLYSIGGVYNFQLFEYPTLPKHGANFILKFKRDNMEDITQIHYPDKQTDQRNRQSFDNFAPLKISYIVPEHIVIAETLIIGLWDENLGWQTDQVQDQKFEEETRQLSFTANKLAPFSLVQNRCEDYPYKGWELRSISPESAMLDLITKRFCMTFIIRPGKIELKDINQGAILKRFKAKQLPPYQLLTEMQKCGINILPSANDAMISEILIKDKDCLDLALNDISKAVSGFYMKSCKWNKTVGVNQTLAFIKFNKDYDESFIENIEKDWHLATWYSNKCGFYSARETNKELIQKYVTNTETRSNFYLAVQQLGKEALLLSQRMKEGINFPFWNTVKEFLYLIQIVGYTQ